MNCPVCNIHLQMSEKQGVGIDYCPQCRGIWLEKGRLDIIIEKSVADLSARTRPQGNREHHDEHFDDHHGGVQRKKRGFLQDLFD